MDLPIRIEPHRAVTPKRDQNRRGGRRESGTRFSLTGAPPPVEQEFEDTESKSEERLVMRSPEGDEVGTRIDVVG